MENIQNLLERILKEQNQEIKVKWIDKFQTFVWNRENFDQISSTNVVDAIVDLAHDLEFYLEDPQHYGEKRMKKEVETVLKKLKSDA